MPLHTDLAHGHLGTPDAVVHRADKCDGHSTIYIAARPQVGLLPLHHKAAGYTFKHRLCLHA